MTRDRGDKGPRCLGAEVSRVFLKSGADVVVGPKWLRADVSMGRDGSRAEVSEYPSEVSQLAWRKYHFICFHV